MLTKKQVIWKSGKDLTSSIQLLKHLVKESDVFTIRVTAMELGPKIYLERRRSFLSFRYTPIFLTEVVGEYENQRIVFNIRENMLSSLLQALIGLIVIMAGVVFAESGQWFAIAMLLLAFVLINAFLFFQVKMGVLYYEKILGALLSTET